MSREPTKQTSADDASVQRAEQSLPEAKRSTADDIAATQPMKVGRTSNRGWPFFSIRLFELDSETFMQRCPDQRRHDNDSGLG